MLEGRDGGRLTKFQKQQSTHGQKFKMMMFSPKRIVDVGQSIYVQAYKAKAAVKPSNWLLCGKGSPLSEI